MKKLIFIVLLAASLFNQALGDGLPSFEEQVGGEKQERPGKIKNEFNKVSDDTVKLFDEEIDGLMSDLGLSIFEELTQFEFYNASFGKVNVGSKVYRRLFPNHDVFDSHTVVDTFEIPVNIPIWNGAESITDELAVGLNLGSSGSFKIENIRQVIPRVLKSYPKWEDFKLKKEFFEKLNFKNIIKFFDESMSYSEEELEEMNSYLSGERAKIKEGEWLEDDRERFYLVRKFKNPTSKARYGKLLNLFTSPLKLPVKAKHIKNLHHGEIVSYTADGMIQLGGSIGWSYNITGIVDPIGGQVSKTTYLNGKYRVSIINEDGRFVRVKLSRLERKGINTSFYPITVRQTILDGVAVLGVGLDQKFIFTPFQFSAGNSVHNSFDVIFRYDLEQEEGRKAYEKAVWGFLKDSYELSNALENDSPAVEKIVSKETKGQTEQKYKKFEINFIFKNTSNKSKTLDHSTIHIPTGPEAGVHYVKNGTVSRIREWSTIWNFKERKVENFRVSLNEEKLNEGDLRGFGLTVEMNTFDNQTTGKEINTYIDQCHAVIGFDGKERAVTEHLPLKSPDVNQEGILSGLNKAWYGESRFLCKAQFDWFHLQQFIHIPREDKISILEKVLSLENLSETVKYYENHSHRDQSNITVNEMRAIRFFEDWEHLATLSEDYDELHTFLTDTINRFKDSFTLAKIFQLAVSNRVVPFLANLYNEAFDHINVNENSFHQVDNITGLANSEFAIDQIGPRTKYDQGASVSAISVNIKKNGNIHLNFHLNQNAKYVFFDLQATRFDASKLRAKLIIQNRGEFQQGLNTFVISPSSSRRISRFYSYFEKGNKYGLGIAYSRDGIRWGGVAGHEFFYRIPKHMEEQVDLKNK